MKSKVTDSTTKISKYIKPFYQQIRYATNSSSRIVAILGCQRSGTTLLSRVLDSFTYTRTFGEFSSLSSECPNNIRLNALSDVKVTLGKVKAPLIVMKPLVESQNAISLLDTLENITAVWLYRNYLDVALSDLKKFPNTSGRGNLQPILDRDENNWRSQNVPKELVETVKAVYSDSLTELDCACLFWFVRNSLFFYQGLERRDDVVLWKYENLMFEPEKHFSQLSDKLKVNLLDYDFSKTFSKSSIKKESGTKLNVEVERLCQTLMTKLDAHCVR
ncbi:sulfotransferase [Alteromonas sp. McT4-15]|uniref:sulfotransferase domain-containing protein n=1 Tax=Alteromonas sp. McT4-15 TaxID=2881256 RepID=UPI001CF86445|nr:sulfotransferase domain-containing protein [Alteromonas sp. McT4-15]MCB4436297.1 sulfotransferase [Alteromonas sp. McT4-15]